MKNGNIKPEELEALAEEADEIQDPAARSVLQKALGLVGIDLSKSNSKSDDDEEEDDDEGYEDDDEGDDDLDGDSDGDDDEEEDEPEDAKDGFRGKKAVTKGFQDDQDDEFEMAIEDEPESESEYDEATPVLKAIADYMDAVNEKMEAQESMLKSLVEQNAETASKLTRVSRRLGEVAKSLENSNELNKSLVGELESRRRYPVGTPRSSAQSHDDEGVLQKGLAGYEDQSDAASTPYGMDDDTLVKGLHSLLMSDEGEQSGITLETLTRLPKIPAAKRPDNWYQAAAKALSIQLPEKR